MKKYDDYQDIHVSIEDISLKDILSNLLAIGFTITTAVILAFCFS